MAPWAPVEDPTTPELVRFIDAADVPGPPRALRLIIEAVAR